MTDAAEPDTRLHAWRPDLADARLEGKVAALRFVAGTAKRIAVPLTPLRRVPRLDASLDTELIRGETVNVFEETPEGWAWVQNVADRYVGYISSDALGPAAPEPTHRISALRTFIYPAADMKLPVRAALSLGSRVAIVGEAETRGTRFGLLPNAEGAVAMAHLESVDAPPRERDFVAVALRFLGVPYLWGGRSSLGLDCSALVQLSLMTAGVSVLRDTDLQAASIGSPVGTEAGLMRGDLVYWKGHVGIMVDARTMVHASGHHMAVVVEPFAEALDRIGRTAGRPHTIRRLA
ncbi:MAG: C40 family peptidase [Rhizobiales bacterium]|nr:C40 family peptidase [Hyphomicrobiales bacterium]MBN9009491.1 C40 family peptidase [Hyphomicrobiales bacterium]